LGPLGFNNNRVWFGGGFNGGGGVPMPFTRPAPNAAFSPDGRLLAHGRANHAVSVWDVATGKEVAQLKGHQGPVETLMVAPDGNSLVTGSRDTTGLIWNMADLAKASRPQTAGVDAASRWKELVGDDAVKAFEAIHALAASPATAVTFLREHLHPAAPANAEQIERLVADLDSEQFAVRKKASANLEKIGDSAAPLLRKALEGDVTLEVRKRIEELLAKTSSTTPRGEALRVLRAIEALEAMGTPEARQVLQQLAGGAPEATMTRAAKSALDRLGG